ncbi:MAG: DUF6318 family protein, partial [Aeromicrobium sp.]
ATTTPAVALPTMPPQASEDSPEGAAAFVKHYVDVFNYAAATGDVKELSRLSAPDCEGCQKYIDLYRDTYAAGGYYRGGDWKIGVLNLRRTSSETFATTQVESGGATYKTDKNAPEQRSATDRIEITFGVSGAGSERRVSQLATGGAP